MFKKTVLAQVKAAHAQAVQEENALRGKIEDMQQQLLDAHAEVEGTRRLINALGNVVG